MAAIRTAIGQLDRRVTLFSRGTATPDAVGQAPINWVDAGTVWAELVPLQGVEVFAAQQVTSEQTIKFRIRYRADVDSTWRLVWQTQNYDITSVLPFGRRNEFTEIVCVHRLNNG